MKGKNIINSGQHLGVIDVTETNNLANKKNKLLMWMTQPAWLRLGTILFDETKYVDIIACGICNARGTASCCNALRVVLEIGKESNQSFYFSFSHRLFRSICRPSFSLNSPCTSRSLANVESTQLLFKIITS